MIPQCHIYEHTAKINPCAGTRENPNHTSNFEAEMKAS